MKPLAQFFFHYVVPPSMLFMSLAMAGLWIASIANPHVGLVVLAFFPVTLFLLVVNVVLAVTVFIHSILKQNLLWILALVIPSLPFAIILITFQEQLWYIICFVQPLVLWLYAETVYWPRPGVKAAVGKLAKKEILTLLLTTYALLLPLFYWCGVAEELCPLYWAS